VPSVAEDRLGQRDQIRLVNTRAPARLAAGGEAPELRQPSGPVLQRNSRPGFPSGYTGLQIIASESQEGGRGTTQSLRHLRTRPRTMFLYSWWRGRYLVCLLTTSAKRSSKWRSTMVAARSAFTLERSLMTHPTPV